MKKFDQQCCARPRKKPKSKCKNSKIGAAMVILGVFTLLALILPLKYWVLILSWSLVILGIMLLKK